LSQPSSSDVVWHSESVTRSQRETLLGQKGACLWFTGLSGSGKSTLANALCAQLHQLGRHTVLLDGDNIRHGLCGDLSFSETDRVENIRRISEVAKLFVEAGSIVLTAFISPFIKDRAQARARLGQDFFEIFVDVPLDICAQRDPKGLYAKAKKGEIKNFTGIDSPYESPVNPELHLKNTDTNISEMVQRLFAELKNKNIL
jgi:adenylylsulfate kinase